MSFDSDPKEPKEPKNTCEERSPARLTIHLANLAAGSLVAWKKLLKYGRRAEAHEAMDGFMQRLPRSIAWVDS
ncbi:hypothetical protein [Halothiobacillus sp. 15-55-196]|uniref:hypothetical protein n=1 Tax=Halothiobacillus sp. 15-55-196 TaxID=1970382 RepID=UPI0025C455FE|nr:hypothetical protein [Halothiobacillus sp. 15-55-196]